jgi:pimeloyl-ACP methyl ester carboxylesterase
MTNTRSIHVLPQLATLVGCSMGASVIWAHMELFGDARIGKCVFVDQVPLQVRRLPFREMR